MDRLKIFSKGLSRPLTKTVIGLLTLGALSTGCAKSSTFSLLPDENTFAQNSSSTLSGKMDILWVIDNSGSMDSSQQLLMANFNRFISKFNEKNFDFQMAVTTTDAYRELFSGTSTSRFRNGHSYYGYSNYRIVTPTTPDLVDTFLINVRQGVWGSGDERAFQSIEHSLTNAANLTDGFLRPDAFLSVIIVSDEDDFSYDGSATIGGQYSNASLHPVDRYVAFLDQLTKASSENRSAKYNVNSIAILDSSCLEQLNSQISGRKIGKRYVELSEKTGGIIGSLCGDFGTTLADISTRIIELSTQFYLNREPDPTTLVVFVNETEVPQDPVNGFQYHAETNSITFHGNQIPGPAAIINVKFEPVSLR